MKRLDTLIVKLKRDTDNRLITATLTAIFILLATHAVDFYSSRVSFQYYEGNQVGIACEGDEVAEVELMGRTSGLRNNTDIYHTMYFLGSNQIAKVLPKPTALAGPDSFPSDFSFVVPVDIRGLKAGDYLYVRNAVQTNSAVIGVDVEISIEQCGD